MRNIGGNGHGFDHEESEYLVSNALLLESHVEVLSVLAAIASFSPAIKFWYGILSRWLEL